MILQALKENYKLNILNMSNNSLTEITTSPFVSMIKSNILITEIWLGDNMLQIGLIDIAMSCNNLTNLQVIELSHNSISPTEVPYTYKFSRDVNFAVFAVNLSSTKFKSLKFYKTVVIHLKYKV